MPIEPIPRRPEPLAGGDKPDSPDPGPGANPDRQPTAGPAGPRTPYPVDDPGIADPDRQLGSTPDVIPATLPPGRM